MAARRLLIVMLILLGLSTLAAALVPQRTLNEGDTTATRTRSVPTTPSTTVQTLPPQIAITVGPKKLPLVRAHVGDQFTLLVSSTKPRQISIPEFGLIGFASSNTPARFQLLAQTPGTFGILFAPSGKVAAKLEVVPPHANKPEKKGKRGKKAKSRARAGSGQA